MAKRVAIIGAGLSGLVSVRACLQEGLEVVCYELTDSVGGLWNYKEEVEEGTASVFACVYANTSKEMSAFSEYPPGDDMATYPHHTRWYQYICDYAVTFGLLHNIKFLHKVTAVIRAEDIPVGDERLQGRVLNSGQWLVEVHDLRNNLVNIHVYDGILVCSGHLTYGRIPSYPNMDKFQGTKIHSSSFRRGQPFVGQRVLVIGFGNSALDIAVECSAHAKKVYLSSRRGGWVGPRTSKGGAPGDATRMRRLKLLLNKLTPAWWGAMALEKTLNERFDHDTYGIKPFNRVLEQYPITNDVIHAYLLNGTVLMRPNVDRFTCDGVIFTGETEETKIDSVIFATGFETKFPYLIGMEDLEPKLECLYKLVFPAWLEKPTLGFVGLVTAGAPHLPLIELQARWVARVLSGKCFLPSSMDMIKDAVKIQRDIDSRFYKGFSNRLYIYGPVYTEEIAAFIGVKPNLWKLLFTDTTLFWACWTGPMLPYHYRLQGPHAWLGARDATLRAQRSWKTHFTKIGNQKKAGCNDGSRKRSLVWATSLTLVVALGIVCRTYKCNPSECCNVISRLLGDCNIFKLL